MRSTLLLAGLLPLLPACAGAKYSYGEADTADGAYEGEGEDDGDGDGWGDTGDSYAPEEEDDYLKLEPAASPVYVFVANPSRDTVTRISVPSLEVITATVGVDPEAVETTEDYTRAVTFNAGSDSVSIIDAETLAVTSVDVRPNLNTLRLSPDGRWALLYHDEDGDDYDNGDGVASFNEVSMVDLVNATATVKVVGFNPREIQFTADGSRAIVVSDAYLGILDLSSPDADPERIALSDDTVDPPEAEEVLLVPDGSYAFVRQFGVDYILVVDLDTEAVQPLHVGLNPTDLDLTPDETHAIAVARGSNELWIYDLADVFAEPRVVTMPDGEVFGSVVMSPDNLRALLYSTASGVSHVASWDLATDEIEVYGLVKPVASVSIAPDGATALLFHDKDNGDVDSSSVFYNHYGLTMVSLSDFFTNPLLLEAEPVSVATDDEGDLGYFIMDGQPYLEILHFQDLYYDEEPLASDPVFVGVLPESRTAYVNQEHPLGRMSFYDPGDETLQTITGFELNAAIEHED